MTMTREATPAPAPRHRQPDPQVRSQVWLGLLAVVVVAAVLRLFNRLTSYDVYVDELIYRDVGRSLGQGNLPPLDTDGQPFLVHPPGLFMLQAGWEAVFRPAGDPFQQVASLRLLQTALAVLSVVLLFVLVRRASGSPAAGLVAAGLFAADPYVIRQNARILQETAVMAFVLAGYVVLVAGTRGSQRRPLLPAASAGLLFGLAVLTKDMAVAVTVVPLLVLLATGWGPPRRHVAVSLAATAVPYGLYLGWLGVRGMADEYWDAKLSLVQRIVGLDVYTGYNANGLSVADTFAAQALNYGVSFALMGAGVCGAVFLLAWPRHPSDRVLAVFSLSGAAMVVYGTLFSTIEEHFFYFVAVPAIATASLGVMRVLQSRWFTSDLRRQRVVGSAIAGVLALVLAMDALAWSRTRFEPDDAHQEAVEWLRSHVPPGEGVAYVAVQTEMALEGTGIRAFPLDDPDRMAASNVTYLVVLEKLVNQGYADATPADVRWYAERGTTVFRDRGRSYDTVTVLRTKDPTVW